MPLLTPPPPAPRRGQRDTFGDLLDEFITWLINFVTELLLLVTGLNTLAAGSAYAIPYTVDLSSTADADPTAGKLRFNAANQNAATMLFADLLGSDGVDYTSMIDQFDASSSGVKGQIRIVSIANPSKFLTFNVSARATATGYRKLTVTNTGGSGANPFAANDAVVIKFTRTGDRGDVSVLPEIYVRDERGVGIGAGDPSGVAQSWQDRALIAVKTNTIAGASLAASQVTLPPGTYEFLGSVPAFGVNRNQARLYNVTDSAVIDHGTSEYANSTYGGVTRSILRGRFTLNGTKTLKMQHYIQNPRTDGFGLAAFGGDVEVYSEIIFRKIG